MSVERVALVSRQTIYPNHTEIFPNGTIITVPADHYDYVPTEWVCALFVALYALSACTRPPSSSQLLSRR